MKDVFIKLKRWCGRIYVKYCIIGLFSIILGFLLIYSFVDSFVVKDEFLCGDGAMYNTCGMNAPYFCNNYGILVKDVVMCGCPESLLLNEKGCVSPYYYNQSNISFGYIFDGKNDYIDISLYEGVANYTDSLPRSLISLNGENYTRTDFKLLKINDHLQREALMPLVVEIENLAPNSKDLQAKIAISLVQNIPYSEPDFVSVFGGRYQMRLSRYPYEVLKDYSGSCEGKSELLVFLLREFGFGVGLFYYLDENHEAVGIKCPFEYSLDGTGYCFIETTLPAPISYSEGRYRGVTGNSKLGNYTEFIFISDGFSLSDDLDDYSDARSLRRIVDYVDDRGVLNYIQRSKLNKLREKYGLIY